MNGAPSETRYPRPPLAILEAIKSEALQRAGEHDVAGGKWVEFGSTALVFLGNEVAVRVARQLSAGDDMRRAQSLVDALPSLPFDVPRSVGDAIDIDGYTAFPVRRLQGEPHPSGSGDARALRSLLDAIRSVDSLPLSPMLARPRRFAGGDAWESVMRDEVVPRLATEVRRSALDRISALSDLPVDDRSLIHGDLAGSNVLWSRGRVTGVLDWDLAAYDDPAEDAAALAAWHGWSLLPQLVDSTTAVRANVFRRTFALQVVAFAVINERPLSETARVIARAEKELRESPE